MIFYANSMPKMANVDFYKISGPWSVAPIEYVFYVEFVDR